MTTFMLFIYFLLQFAPTGFNSTQYLAIEKAFNAGAEVSARNSGGAQLVPPSPEAISIKPLTQVQGQQFSPVVSEVVPTYQKPRNAKSAR